MPTLYVLGKARTTLSAPDSGTAGLNSRVSWFSWGYLKIVSRGVNKTKAFLNFLDSLSLI